MALVMVAADLWVAISPDYELFVRPDALTDPGYRVRVEASVVGGLQVRCLAPLPAGFWLRPIGRRDLWIPPGDRYTTEEFRLDSDDYPHRRVPGEGPARRIDPRSVRTPE
jgi:hypothetical protein